ncbi:MAG TPA: circadian clock protein KaiB [Cyanothece sp. UBA12306]|nr:circadian clock protein KaiB [Cyanothece sp. UBA12306]
MVLPELFKGIALFTPGGDLIYCRDRSKQIHWHSHLCVALQELLHLPEPPHFLIPGYTATIDRWFSNTEGTVKTVAELYPALRRYQPLLNVIFEVEDLVWTTADWLEEACNPIILESYRPEFPQLWENHDLIVCLSNDHFSDTFKGIVSTPVKENQTTDTHQGYILRLFVAGNNSATKHTLQIIHQLLEQELQHPYTLKLVDISKNPEEAETHQVSATPTLVRVWPKPVKRIVGVGELEELSRVLQLITN